MDTSNPGQRPRRASIMDLPTAGRVLAAIAAEDADFSTSDFPSIQGYVIDKRLGGGAGGEVYRALREGTDQFVALKVLNQRLGESPGSRRAWRELDMLAQLRLPSIPRLLDHGEHEGRLYLVTEFVDGMPLLEYSKRQMLNLRAKVELLARVADVLLELHEFAVIHRDMKPANILINTRGQPVLVDLGIATLLARSVVETLTQEGSPIGTPAYMSPEQARGETRAISTRSDIYSLGATAYVLLTGQTPHAMDVTIHEAIRRVAHDPPREPREIEPSLPKPLAAILHKAVAAHPEQRYESAGAMAADLRRWLRGDHVEASGMSVAQRIGRFIGRHPVATTASACLIVAVLSLSMTAVTVWWLNMRPNALEIDPVDRAWVRLVSHSGRELHRWDDGTIRSAQMVHRPAEYGGGRLALISYADSPDPRLSGQLCAFDVSDPTTLLWASGVDDTSFEMPTPISMNKGDSMSVIWMQVHDVFPESPGQEIVICHRLNQFSATSIRIYAMDGRVLYEVWHDGFADDGYWLKEEGLLILCGLNSEGLWARRGYSSESVTTNPLVVFALRPEFAKRYRQWVRTPGGKGTFDPVWYKCLFPPDEVERFRYNKQLMELDRPSHHTRHELIRWSIATDIDGAALFLILDDDGQIVDRFTSDTYRAAGDALPDPAVFSLQPLPPLIAEDDEPVLGTPGP